MTERTIDLDALAAELRAAGCETKRWDDDEYPSYLAVNLPVSDNPRRSIEWDVMDDGDVILYDDIQFGDKAFQSVDIIRRHVDPVPDLHAKLLDIFQSNTTSYGAGNATCSEFDGVAAADAILQLLGYPAVERPTRAAAPVEEGEMPW